MSEHDAICRAQEAVVPQLLAQPGVTGVGVGLREKGGQPTDEIVIRVYVARKRPASAVPAAELIPSEIGGFATDVIEKGPDEHCGFFDDYRQRPIGSGLAIERVNSDLGRERGTIGCFVARRLTEAQRNYLTTRPGGSSIIRPVYLLSAAHVLNPPNALDRVVYQPHPLDRVAETDPSLCVYAGALDAGLARLDPDMTWANKILNIGDIAGVRRARAKDVVYKWGTTTGLTSNTVTDFNHVTHFPGTTITFGPGFSVTHNIFRNPFGLAGDSGSLVYVADEGPGGAKKFMAVGLLVFVADITATMCHLDTVLDTLDFELVELTGGFAKGQICTMATPDGRIVSV